MGDPLIVYTVYKHPSDYPEQWVVRRSEVHPGEIRTDLEPLIVTSSLRDARRAVPPFLYRQPRDPNDDPVIYEIWF